MTEPLQVKGALSHYFSTEMSSANENSKHGLVLLLKGQRHGDLVLFQKPKNVFGSTETVK